MASVETCTVLLYDRARDDVLKGLAEVMKLLHALLTYDVDPVGCLASRQNFRAHVRVVYAEYFDTEAIDRPSYITRDVFTEKNPNKQTYCARKKSLFDHTA